MLDVAVEPEEMNVAGLRSHPLQGKPPAGPVRVTGCQAGTPSNSILRITIGEELMNGKGALPAVHPGGIVRENILPEFGHSVRAAAKALGVSRQMRHHILAERRPLSAAMCLRSSRLFGAAQDKKDLQDIPRIVSLEQLRANSHVVPLKREVTQTEYSHIARFRRYRGSRLLWNHAAANRA